MLVRTWTRRKAARRTALQPSRAVLTDADRRTPAMRLGLNGTAGNHSGDPRVHRRSLRA
jgi:hypothetical protein